MFPHHENEIAQSEAANGKKFANIWMHNGPLRVDDEKMSKSLDNFFTIREVLKSYDAEVVRYLLISSHYRSPINYSDKNLQQSANALKKLYLAIKGSRIPVLPSFWQIASLKKHTSQPWMTISIPQKELVCFSIWLRKSIRKKTTTWITPASWERC